MNFKFIIFILSILILCSCSSSTTTETISITDFTFTPSPIVKETTTDGEKCSYNASFTNIGDEILIFVMAKLLVENSLGTEILEESYSKEQLEEKFAFTSIASGETGSVDEEQVFTTADFADYVTIEWTYILEDEDANMTIMSGATVCE